MEKISTFPKWLINNIWLGAILIIKEVVELAYWSIQSLRGMEIPFEFDWFDFCLKVFVTILVMVSFTRIRELSDMVDRTGASLKEMEISIQVKLFIWDFLQSSQIKDVGTSLFTVAELEAKGDASIYHQKMQKLERDLVAAIHQKFPDLTGAQVQKHVDETMVSWRSR